MDKSLSFQQKQVLYGILLGNSSLQSTKEKCSYRLRCVQSETNKAYLWHLYFIFAPLVGTEPNQMQDNFGNKRWYFNSKFYPFLKEWYLLFYDENRKKRVPSNIEEVLDIVVLAYWFMDNGSRRYSYAKGFRFCTDAYNLRDVEKLTALLQERFALSTTIFKQRDRFRIGIRAASHDRFVSLIQDHVLPEVRISLLEFK